MNINKLNNCIGAIVEKKRKKMKIFKYEEALENFNPFASTKSNKFCIETFSDTLTFSYPIPTPTPPIFTGFQPFHILPKIEFSIPFSPPIFPILSHAHQYKLPYNLLEKFSAKVTLKFCSLLCHANLFFC